MLNEPTPVAFQVYGRDQAISGWPPKTDSKNGSCKKADRLASCFMLFLRRDIVSSQAAKLGSHKYTCCVILCA